MTAKIFIDGEAGTTGLQIKERLENRKDIELLHLGETERKDANRRRDMLNEADLAILCLPDDAAREAVSLIENPHTRVIDPSTAHRTAEGWVYGFPEYDADQRDLIIGAKRVSNPGCYSLASIAILHPLISTGIIPADWPVTINAVSGYTGGGNSLIAEYENTTPETGPGMPFFTYAHTLSHKHLPEMVRWSGLANAPIFMPSVGRYAQGMIVQVPIPIWVMPGHITVSSIHETIASHYEGQESICVAGLEEGRDLARLDPESANGTNELRLYVMANDDGTQAVVMGLLDNLGKGASGQAVQNMNLMLGFPELAGL